MKTLPWYKHYFLLLVILLLFFSLFLLFKFTRFHYFGWDESVYLGMARSISSFGTFGLWEDIRPPLLPLFLSIGFLSDSPLFIAELLLLFFAIGTIILTYLIAEHLFNKHIADLSALLLVLTPLFFSNSIQILTGIPSVFFVILSFYLALQSDHRSYLFLAGLFASLAFLTRFPSGLIMGVLSVLFFLYPRDKQHFSMYLLHFFSIVFGFLLPFLLFMIVNAYLYHTFTANILDAMLRPLLLGTPHQANILHALDGFLANVSFYPIHLFWNNPLFLFSFFSLGYLFFGKSVLEKKRLFMILLPLLFFSLYFFSIPNKQLRFADVFLPFLSILSAYGIFLVFTLIKNYHHTFLRYAAFLLLLIYIVFSITHIFVGVRLSLRFFPEQQPPIVADYYSFFVHNNISTTHILTTDPRFAVYDLSNKYIPFYDTVSVAHQVYSEKKAVVDYVVYDPEFFPCSTLACEVNKDALHRLISDENILIYDLSGKGRIFQVS